MVVVACVPQARVAEGRGRGDEPLVPVASWTVADPAGSPSRCELAATASEWRRLRVELGAAAAAVPEPPCDFVATRVVVAWLRGSGVGPPVAMRIGTEEGVDVVTLQPNVPAAASPGTVVHVFVVPERRGQLAVVAAMPEGGELREQTLAVFPAH